MRSKSKLLHSSCLFISCCIVAVARTGPQQEEREFPASKELAMTSFDKLFGWQRRGSGPWSTQQQLKRLECQLRVCLLRDVEEEEAADLGAFQREYEDDHSWEALQEDEFGRLRPLVCLEP